MKYRVFFLFAAALFCAVVLFSACAAVPLFRTQDGVPQDALFSGSAVCEGSAQGLRGPISVRVRIEDGVIAEIEILESSEDPFVGGAAMEEILEQVLLYNNTDLDAVSGATESSKGFLAAVENAILNYE
jgi:uncharacterized protein with FMN-binding domain